MESLFEEKTAELFINRIRNLKPDAKALWGKMTVSQMLVHAQKGLLTASGELELKRVFAGYLFGGIARKSLTGNDKPFSKNLPQQRNS
jgi:hypothetical protein